MLKGSWIFAISAFLTLGIFFWWFNHWAEPIYLTTPVENYLWRDVEKTGDSWQRNSPKSEKPEFWSYQSGGVVLYGQGAKPEISDNDEMQIIFGDDTKAFTRSFDSSGEITLESKGETFTLKGIGGLYVDGVAGNVVNFDGHVTIANGGELFPNFSFHEKKKTWFDISTDNAFTSSDLWKLYRALLPVDQNRILGTVTKVQLDNYLHALKEREPQKSDDIFHYDLRIRNALEEIELITTQISKGQKCGASYSDCRELLEKTLESNIRFFPEVFLGVRNAVNTWLALDTQSNKSALTWQDIYAAYYAQLLAGRPDAQTIRDKRILQIIQTSTSDATLESWTYLTQMIAGEKTGSVYLLQLMREMVRIGNGLIANSSDSESAELRKTALASLINLKELLQNTYFTQKDYWFELRNDLIDSEGQTILPGSLVIDLKSLIADLKGSPLFVTSESATEKQKRILMSQLNWFECILSRNAEYVANPSICRATISK